MGKPGLPSQHPASLVIVLVIVIIILPHADYDYDYDYDYEEDWLTGAGELVACQHDLAFHIRRDAGRLQLIYDIQHPSETGFYGGQKHA